PARASGAYGSAAAGGAFSGRGCRTSSRRQWTSVVSPSSPGPAVGHHDGEPDGVPGRDARGVGGLGDVDGGGPDLHRGGGGIGSEVGRAPRRGGGNRGVGRGGRGGRRGTGQGGGRPRGEDPR